MNSSTRSKFGYLNYGTMLSKIESHELDAYDINFTPDTKECYIIAPDLTPWSIKSKVYTFDSIESALECLRQNTDTYEGQIIAIKLDDKYRSYIVNSTSDGWEVNPLSECEKEIDYNSIGNQPITNLIGTLDSPINAESLDNGIYKVKGQYTISSKLETIFLSASDTLLIVKHDENSTLIKMINADEIIDYFITDSDITFSTLITSDFIDSKGYATEEYVDAKISALNILTRDEVETYVQQVVNDSIDTTLDEKIEQKLDEKLQNIDDSEIDSLF